MDLIGERHPLHYGTWRSWWQTFITSFLKLEWANQMEIDVNICLFCVMKWSETLCSSVFKCILVSFLEVQWKQCFIQANIFAISSNHILGRSHWYIIQISIFFWTKYLLHENWWLAKKMDLFCHSYCSIIGKKKNNASVIEWILRMTYEQFVYRYRLGMDDYNLKQKSSVETSGTPTFTHPHKNTRSLSFLKSFVKYWFIK